MDTDTLVSLVTAVVTIASIIARLTPTEVDNVWMARILKAIDIFALNNKPTEHKK